MYVTSEFTLPVKSTPWVCGRILAFQNGSALSLLTYLFGTKTLESAYLDGLSLTHGAPLPHLTDLKSFFGGKFK